MNKRKSIITIAIIVILTLMLCVSGCTISTPTEYSNQDVTQDDDDEAVETDVTDDTDETTDEDMEQKRHITILGNSSTFRQNISRFVMSFTDIEFSLIESENGYTLSSDEIVPRLLSGDDSFDIYQLYSYLTYSSDLIKQGYYVDLSAYPEISGKFEHMYPALAEGSKANGEIFGFPMYASTTSVLFYSDYYFDKLGWSASQITTVDDLYELNAALIEKGYENKVVIGNYAWYEHTLSDYIFNNFDYENYSINLDTPEFYELLEAAKRLYDSGLVYEYDEFNAATQIAALTTKLSATPLNNYCIDFPQITDQKNMFNVNMGWYIINPYSKNTDLAVEVLDILGEVYKVPSQTYLELYKDLDYYKESTIDLTMLQEKVGVTQARLDYMTNVYATHKRFFPIVDDAYLIDPFSLYIDGEIDAQEAVERMQRAINTISAERSIDD